MADARFTEGPEERLTRLCAAMTDALDAHPECGDARCMVFLDSESEGRGGIQIHGYEDENEAMANLFFHLKAIFNAQGKDLHFAPMPGPPGSGGQN